MPYKIVAPCGSLTKSTLYLQWSLNLDLLTELTCTLV